MPRTKKAQQEEKTNNYKGFHRNRRPHRIISGIKEEGLKLTASEWAEKLNCSKSFVYTLLSDLRKKGYHFHPVGSVFSSYSSDPQEGVIVDIMENEDDYAEIVERSHKYYLMPSVVGTRSRTETGLNTFRSTATQRLVNGYWNTVIAEISEGKPALK